LVRWQNNQCLVIYIDMHYLIYKITNKLNNKFYVGAHKTHDKNDEYFGSGKILSRSVEKHGKEKFHKEILHECQTEDDMWVMEANIVDDEFIARPDTYNIKCGGCGGFDFINNNNMNNVTGRAKGIIDKQELARMRDIFSKQLQDSEYKAEFARKISNSLKIYYSVNPPTFTNRTHSPETKEKMRKAKLGKFIGKNNPSYGTMWITDGTVNKKIKKTESIPDGWRNGRI